MISFNCTHCAQKLNVKDEFAGRSSRCPSCKQMLTVPIPSKTAASVATNQIDGTLSSLAQVGIDSGVTLDQAAGAGVQKSVQEVLARKAKNRSRYIIESELARGGMGAVLRAVDCDLRREVAVKYMLDDKDPKKKARFIEEAQITGQLEHPNIVPIHELGVDAQKRLFFSMKIVKGRSLAQVLDDLRGEPGHVSARSLEKEFSLGRLLNIFVNVCHALAYAHARGVVHRDLKPANIMLGDFGEVYVMDWGLAKVLKNQDQASGVASVSRGPANQVHGALTPPRSPRDSKVVTNRQADADLTQEGAVLGTPVYMPPEQASGDLQAIDQRSDVYSLGAILYEIMTLQPPIDKEGGYLAILMRVSEGEIVAPEQRDPKRAKKGKIPKELSAVAMKALARQPQDRYATVEALRRDIELFQEGRSVSAKEDTKWELMWKFVKRNKGFCAATLLIMVILAWSSWDNLQARLETERNHQQYLQAQKEKEEQLQKAQKEKEEQLTKALPLFVRAARFAVHEKQFPDALSQLNLILTHAPDHAEALLLKGQVSIGLRDFATARTALEKYTRQKPGDTDSARLLDCCKSGKPDDPVILVAISEILQKQQAYTIAERVLRYIESSEAGRKQLLAVYQKKIDAAWPGLGSKLSMDNDFKYHLNLAECKEVTSLQPLNGIPLSSLNLAKCERIQDLSPLKGMPLERLDLHECGRITDLAPLKGLPLTWLSLSACRRVKDLSPLTGMALTSLNLHVCNEVTDLAPLEGMPLTSLSLLGCGQLTDLSALHGMQLTALDLGNCGGIPDLTPLQGMPLTSLSLMGCGRVTDLAPLKGSRLTSLNLWLCGVTDLSPLRGLPLTSLYLRDCRRIVDLTPLAGLKRLNEVFLPPQVDRGTAELRKITTLKMIHDLPAAAFWKKFDAGDFPQYKP